MQNYNPKSPIRLNILANWKKLYARIVRFKAVKLYMSM